MSWSGKRRRCQGGLEVGGLFSPGDWQCVKCANINWARRYRCNICGEAKYPKVEARTGTGGGYDDREEVEYVKREDSDEEFDHFGRRKKRLEKLGMGDEKDEEVEEEENDEDLSKYDLFAEDEIDEEFDQAKCKCKTSEENTEDGKEQEDAKKLSK